MWSVLATLWACAEAPSPMAAAPAPAQPPAPAAARFGEGPDWPVWHEGSVALRAWARGPGTTSRNPGVGTLEDATFAPPADLPLDELLRDLARAQPGLFGGMPASELLTVTVEASHAELRQVREGAEVFGAFAYVDRVRDGVRVRARLLPAGGDPAVPEGSAEAASATARAWVASSDLWGRRMDASRLTRVEPAWFDPGLLFPGRATGPRRVWKVTAPEEPSLKVIVDGGGREVLYVKDYTQPSGQLHAELVSYLPKGGQEREFAKDVYTLMDIQPGDAVGDVGAGSGAFTWPLSALVGRAGTVWANDIDDVAIDFLERRLQAEPPPHPNVEVVRSFTNDMRIPPDTLDAALLCQAHFFVNTPPESHGASLRSLLGAMKPGGLVVVVEAKENGDLATMRRPWEITGFEFVKEHPRPGSDWFLVFRRPG